MSSQGKDKKERKITVYLGIVPNPKNRLKKFKRTRIHNTQIFSLWCSLQKNNQ